jgi:hypothetical protein
MSKLEHVKLEFRAHEMECLHGPSTLGIQHLSSLHRVEIILRCKRYGYDRNYNPMEDDYDDTVRCISRAINAAIETLSNRPTPRFETEHDCCEHFESVSSLTEQHALMVLSSSQLLLPHSSPFFHLAAKVLVLGCSIK